MLFILTLFVFCFGFFSFPSVTVFLAFNCRVIFFLSGTFDSDAKLMVFFSKIWHFPPFFSCLFFASFGCKNFGWSFGGFFCFCFSFLFALVRDFRAFLLSFFLNLLQKYLEKCKKIPVRCWNSRKASSFEFGDRINFRRYY